jgi:hypothetical protein
MAGSFQCAELHLDFIIAKHPGAFAALCIAVSFQYAEPHLGFIVAKHPEELCIAVCILYAELQSRFCHCCQTP